MHRKLKAKSPWGKESKTLTAADNLEMVLAAVKNLPIKYWQPSYFFSGAGDEILSGMSDGEFPKKIVPGKTHPIFSLKPIQGNAGYEACPCSSSKPYGRGHFRYIQKGCRLGYTGHIMDRNSYLVESIRLNIPRSVAFELRFKGEVPGSCLKEVDRG